MGDQTKNTLRPLLIAFLGLASIGILARIFDPPPVQPPKSAAQIKLEQEQAAERAIASQARAKADQESQARHAHLCKWVDLCSKFGEARQACATAGDFQNCINVKLGDNAWVIGDNCSNDGSLINPQNDTPSKWQCVDVSLKDTLHIKD
ncbi:hypothetical protein [Mesorhizobium sp. CA4]|uniref:hypothetical protein n=1 Tax=Mesorhizobium sp. CA4 TaxID=588499 RepID=UPI001CD0E1D1|nr:hypothetical protein [Mesorhizobium sp. CA4]MBZ9820171.1 hypothetical protein [Mesorhizobium sp. CA4]